MSTDTDKGAWSPGEKYRTLLSQIRRVLEGGERRTVRDVYYALEARGHDWEYRYAKRAVKKGRRAGMIDPSQIVDASRTAEYTTWSGYDDPLDFIDRRVDGIWNDYAENFWREQEHYVEVWLEKQSLASVFEPICKKYNVRLEATRGDWSDSKVYEATQRLIGRMQDGKDVRVLYFGDYNPSGYHAPVSILDAMGYYGLDLPREFPDSDDQRYYDPEWGAPFDPPDSEFSFGLERKGLNTEHIERFDLPENPVPSGTDKDATIKKHFRRYVSDGRDTNVELNALKEYHREFLEGLVEGSISEYIDEDVKETVEERVDANRDELEDAIDVDRSPFQGGESA